MTDRIEIPLSKTKLTKLLIGSIAFVAIGFWFIISSPATKSGLFKNTTLVQVVGIASILFFGYITLSIFKKLRNNDFGLIVDKTGITDNSSGLSVGHIPWADIKEINISQLANQKFLMIIVFNPYDYINRNPNRLKRLMAELNFTKFGSPISISANSLKSDFDELKTLLKIQFDKNK